MLAVDFFHVDCAVTLRRLAAELGTPQAIAGRLTGEGRWAPSGWVLDAKLVDVQPARLDARAPSMRLSGPVALAGGTVEVLIYNTQTEGAIPKQVRSSAEHADVPVVNVTESVPPSFDTFVGWQLHQLQDLAQALGA